MSKEINWWMIVAIVAVLLLLFGNLGNSGFGWCGSSGYNNDRYDGMMSWMFGNSSNYVFGPFMIIGMLIAWGIAIVIFIYFIKMITGSLNQSNSKRNGGKNARRN